MKNHHDKRPFATLHPDPRHWTRKGKMSWKAKKSYGSEEEAYEWLAQNPKLRDAGYQAYLCPVCSKWHIGH